MSMLTVRQLKKGQSACIVRFAGITPAGMHKMMALGLTPGDRLEVLQTYPTYVLRFGHTQLALDRRLAQGIEVELRP